MVTPLIHIKAFFSSYKSQQIPIDFILRSEHIVFPGNDFSPICFATAIDLFMATSSEVRPELSPFDCCVGLTA